jgi:tripartite-type tricarboxylate transporter receptor subunit TctC
MAKLEFIAPRRRRLTTGIAATMLLSLPAMILMAPTARGADAAADYPAKPIRMIVPYAPGGLPDITARLIAPGLGARLGQQVVVENRPGANGAIGTAMVARASPDGYTLALVASSHVFGRALMPNLPFDPVKDFAPITMTTRTPIVLVASGTLPVKTLDDMLRYVRERPGQLAYASAGTGSNTHVFGKWFTDLAGLNMTHIPYKGSAPAHVDLISGRVAMGFETLASAQPNIASGELKLLAVAGDQRLPQYPDVPTVEQAGIQGFVAESWGAILAPAGTPAAVVARLNRDIVAVLNTPEVKERLAGAGAKVVGNSPEQLRQTLAAEEERYGTLIKKMNILLE